MKYDLSSFKPIINQGDFRLSMKSKSVMVSIKVKRALIDMKAFVVEILKSDDNCICLHAVSKTADERPSLYEIDRLVSAELRRCREDICETYGISLDSRTKLVMHGIYDESQNSIFFPKEMIKICEVVPRAK